MSNRLPEAWRRLRRFTEARVALPAAGVSEGTASRLDFELAWARARDAVHAPLDADAWITAAREQGLAVVAVESQAGDRSTYLRRPDLGRRLTPHSEQCLGQYAGGFDIALVVADGLSARAVQDNALPLLDAFLPEAAAAGWRYSPVVLACQGRVAVGDHIGQCLGARMTVLLIGERPGLSAADSLGVYFTYAPGPGRTDAERNCISNIRNGGQDPAAAARILAYLCRESLRLGLSGVALKDRSRLLDMDGGTES